MKKFIVTLEDGKLKFSSAYQQKEAHELLSDGKYKGELQVKSRVTQPMRGYYFAGIVGFIHKLKVFPQLARYPLVDKVKDVYHELLKREFNGVDIDTGKETIRFGRSIAVEDKEEFHNYVERINDYLIENYGVRLPTPEEYKEHRDTLIEGDFVDKFYDDQTIRQKV